MNTAAKNLILLSAVATLAAQLAVAQSSLKPSDVAGVWEGTLHAFGQDSRLVYVIAVYQDGLGHALRREPLYSVVHGRGQWPEADAELAQSRRQHRQ